MSKSQSPETDEASDNPGDRGQWQDHQTRDRLVAAAAIEGARSRPPMLVEEGTGVEFRPRRQAAHGSTAPTWRTLSSAFDWGWRPASGGAEEAS